jgi:hypothetical protein
MADNLFADLIPSKGEDQGQSGNLFADLIPANRGPDSGLSAYPPRPDQGELDQLAPESREDPFAGIPPVPPRRELNDLTGAQPRTGGAILSAIPGLETTGLTDRIGENGQPVQGEKSSLRKQKAELKTQAALDEAMTALSDGRSEAAQPLPRTALDTFNQGLTDYDRRIGQAAEAPKGLLTPDEEAKGRQLAGEDLKAASEKRLAAAVDAAIKAKVNLGAEPAQSQSANRNRAETALASVLQIPQGFGDAALILGQGAAELAGLDKVPPEEAKKRRDAIARGETRAPVKTLAEEFKESRDKLDQRLSDLAKGDPTRREDFDTQLIQGMGSTVGFAAAGVIGKALGLSSFATTALAGALPEASQLYTAAEQKGLSKTQQWLSFVLGLGIGATEAGPISQLLERWNHTSGGLLARIVQASTHSATEEGLQEGSQQVGEDAVKRYVQGEDISPSEGVGQATLIGALTGAGFAAGHGALHSAPDIKRLFPAPDPPKVPDDVQQQILQELRTGGPAPISAPAPTPQMGDAAAPTPPIPPMPPRRPADPVTPVTEVTPGQNAPVSAQNTQETAPNTTLAPAPAENPQNPQNPQNLSESAPGAPSAPSPDVGVNAPSEPISDEDARLLIGSGLDPEVILDMSPTERADALRQAREEQAPLAPDAELAALREAEKAESPVPAPAQPEPETAASEAPTAQTTGGAPPGNAPSVVRSSDDGLRPAEADATGGAPQSAPDVTASHTSTATQGDGEQTSPQAPGFTGNAPRKGKKPLTLTQFIASRGGLAPSAELNARDLHKTFVPGHGRLVRKSGMTLDRAREAAVEAGYLRDTGVEGNNLVPGSGVSRSTTDDLLNGMEFEASKRGVIYTEADRHHVPEREPDQDQAEFHAHGAILDSLAEMGLPEHQVDPELLRRAAELAARNEASIEDAYERAAMELAGDYANVAERAEAEHIDLPGFDHEPPPPRSETQARADHERGEPARREPAPQEQAESSRELPEGERAPRAEEGADGKPQLVIPGAEKESQGDLAKRKADQPLKPKKAQDLDTSGMALFGDGHKQADLLDAKPAEKAPEKASTGDIFDEELDKFFAEKPAEKPARTDEDLSKDLAKTSADNGKRRHAEMREMGKAAFERGDPREHPVLTGTPLKAWLAGYDAAKKPAEKAPAPKAEDDGFDAAFAAGQDEADKLQAPKPAKEQIRPKFDPDEGSRTLEEGGRRRHAETREIGKAAFERGDPREPHPALREQGRKAWLAGYDAAKKAAEGKPKPLDPVEISRKPPLERTENENRALLAHLEAKRFKTASDEKQIKLLQDRLKAKPDKWKAGDGVGYRVAGHGGKDQINRGFRIVSVDPEAKTAVVRSVADTGLTSTGGNSDRIGDQTVHLAELVRDNRYNQRRTMGGVKPDRTKAEVAKSAASNAAASADAALSALSTLFNSKGRPGSGFTFDEETYAKAKPLFIQAAQKFAAFKDDIAELVRRMVVDMRTNFGLTREGMEAMKPYMRRFVDDVKAGAIDVSGGSENLERDRGLADARNGLGEADVPAATGRHAGSAEPGGEADRGGEGRPAAAGDGVSDGDAAALGAEGDRALRGEPSAGGSGAPERGVGGGSRDAREQGILDHEPRPEAVGRDASDAPGVESRQRAQEKAESIPVKPGDLENIRKTLPMLLPQQQEDVHRAETRYAKPDGHGMLFTNGTGTGKTFSGLGIVKRFARQGKNDILIAAPSQGILEDWVKAAKTLGLDVGVLESTQDAGKGIVATTYANLGDNQTLADRSWDLVVADESHKLMQNEKGETTSALETLRAITNHPRGLYTKADHLLRAEREALKALEAEAKDLLGSDDERNWHRAGALEPKIDQLTRELADKRRSLREKLEGEPRSKVTFLSATPFAYDKTVDYAEGYLFDYPEGNSARYNQASGRDLFFVQNFGYRMRYNRLTEPEAGVNSEVLERQFHEKLKREGVLSGRKLDVEADYNRHFVLTEDALGQQIDAALEVLSANDRFRPLHDAIYDNFDYLTRQRLLEAIKAHEAVDVIRKDLALGRKVVVFHDFNTGGGFDPFQMPAGPKTPYTWREHKDGKTVEHKEELGAVWADFLKAAPYVEKLNFSQMGSPIETLTKAFPNALVYNGTIPIKKRSEAKRLFNEDGSGRDVIIVQSAAGEAGISLHDTTGKHQRALHNLGMPTRPTTAIQEEGRIYRTGQVSDAIFRYYNTGTSWERWTFASKIAERASTAENLALGEEARALRQSFVDAFNTAAPVEPGQGEGRGGKQADRGAAAGISPFERAKTYYWAEQKTKGKRDQREGLDYYATPEPIGLKMVEWAGIKFNDRVLEPSAGHGAIARFLPEGANRTLIEPSQTLLGRAALSSPGAKTIGGTFENHHITNKYDAIVMNPPFGSGGKTAIDHLNKAVTHLRNGGRVVALLPEGVARKRYDEWYEKAPKEIVQVAAIELPSVAFERAGTAVRTRIVILEKQTDEPVRQKLGASKHIDLSGAETIKDLFDRIENLSMPERLEPQTEEAEALPDTGEVEAGGHTFVLSPSQNGKLLTAKVKGRIDRQTYENLATIARRVDRGMYGDRQSRSFSFEKPEARAAFIEAVSKGPQALANAPQVGASQAASVSFDLAQTKHAKTGGDLYVASLKSRVERQTYDLLNSLARENGGWYSNYDKAGAIPGFQFKSEAKRQAFVDAASGALPERAENSSHSVIIPKEAFTPNPALIEQMRDMTDRMVGDHARAVEMVSRILTTVDAARSSGATGTGATEARGLYSHAERIIRIASKGDAATLFHEITHLYQALGAYAPQEKALLDRERARNRAIIGQTYNVTPQQLAQLSDTEVDAVSAELFIRNQQADAGAANASFHIGVRRLFQRIYETFRRVVNALQGLGYQISDDIWRRQTAGEMKLRLDEMAAGTRERGTGYGKGWEVEQARGHATPGQDFSALTRLSRDTQDEIARRNAAAGLTPSPGRAPVQTFQQPERTMLENARSVEQDSFARLQAIQKAIETARGAPLPNGVNAYLAQTLFPSKSQAALKRYEDDEVSPITKALIKAKVDPSELGLYLLARHAEERNATIAGRNPKYAQDGGSGMATQVARDYLADFAASGRDKVLEPLARQVYALLRQALQRKLDAGLITQKQFDQWTSQWKNYVPLRGVAEEDEGDEGFFSPVGKGFDLRGKESKAAAGRESLGHNPYLMALELGAEAILRAEKNKAGKALLALAQQNSHDDEWKVYRVGDKGRYKLPTKEVVGSNGQVVKVPDLSIIQGKNEKNAIGVKVGGKQWYVVLTSPNLAAAYKNLGPELFSNPFFRGYHTLTRQWAQLNTGRNPEFFINNFRRDVMEAASNLFADHPRLVPTFAKLWTPALRAAANDVMGRSTNQRWDDLVREWQENGGKILYNARMDLEARAKSIEAEIKRAEQGALRRGVVAAPKALLHAVDGLNDTLESATRLAVYAAAREHGMTPAKAAQLSLDMTVNFNRRGRWSSVTNTLWAFSNAATQGTTNMMERLVRSNRYRALFAGMGALGFGLSLLNHLMWPDDDDPEKKSLFSKVPEWERSSYLLLPYGVETVNGVKRLKYWKVLPMAFGFRIPWGFGEQMAALMLGQTTGAKAAKAVLSNTLDAFNPIGQGSPVTMIFPSLVRPLAEWGINENWLRHPIVPKAERYNAGLPHSSQYAANANPAAVTVAQKVNELTGGDKFARGYIDAYPAEIEHFISSYTGGAGKTVMNLIHTGTGLAEGVPLPFEKTPVLRQFMGATGFQAEQARYYEEREEFTEKQNRLRAARKALEANPQDEVARRTVRELAAETGARVKADSDRIDWKHSPTATAFTEADGAIKEKRAEQTAARTDKNLTGSERQKKVETIETDLEKLMRRVRLIKQRQEQARKAS